MITAVVAGRESRDLWFGVRGPVLLFGFSALLSVTTYLAATNQLLNFLEQRQAVSLTVQVAVAVGVLGTLLVAADAISGERERGTLESLLLSPVPRRPIFLGKLAATQTLWLACFAVAVPYVWVLANGVELVGPALLVALVTGSLLALALGATGLLISGVAGSNKASLAIAFFLLLALFTPTQLPTAPAGWVSDLLSRVNPVHSALLYVEALLVKGHRWTADLSYLISPGLAAVLGCAALVLAAPRLMSLTGGMNR